MNTTTRNFSVSVFACLTLTAFSFAFDGDDSSVGVPHSFESGTPALASEVNENFDCLVVEIDVNRSMVSENADRLDQIMDPENLIRVAAQGAPFTSVAAALASITDASADNPYVVEVAPGVYQENTLMHVTSYVRLKGCGMGSTIIKGDRTGTVQNSDAALVRLDDLGAVSDLTLVNEGQDSTYAIGIFGAELSRQTAVTEVEILVNGAGSVAHYGLYISESNLLINRCQIEVSGATTINGALGSVDQSGPFAQPMVKASFLNGLGITTGYGVQATNTAIQVVDSEVVGEFRGMTMGINGSSRVKSSKIQTSGLNPIYEVTGSASVLSAHSIFQGGNPIGLSTFFKYVHCAKANFDPVVNGLGSDIDT